MLLRIQLFAIIFLLFPSKVFSQVTDLPAGIYGGMFRDESTGKVWLDFDAMSGRRLNQRLIDLYASPFVVATYAEIQPLLDSNLILDSATGSLLPCFPDTPGNHLQQCKHSIFNDYETGQDVLKWGLAGAELGSSSVYLEYDRVNDFNFDSTEYGTWAVQRLPALRQNPDPRSADFDGDGIDEKIVWRKSTGSWYIKFSVSNEVLQTQWGLPGDIPLVGDYTGDHIPDIVVWRPSNGSWYLLSSSTLFDKTTPVIQQFGLPGDVPMRGDYDSDGILDYAVWRPVEGRWYVLRSSTHEAFVEQWGLPGDIPVAGGRGPN